MFDDPATGECNLAHAAESISPELAAALPGLLSESPDPDSAVMLFDRLVSASSGEIARLLHRHHLLAHYALAVFAHSRFLAETLLQNPDLLGSFLHEKNLDRSLSREEFQESMARFRSRSLETDVSLLMARFKRRALVRIMLRDVLRIASLAETTAEISALADVLIEEALHEAERLLLRRYEAPQHLDGQGRFADTPFAILSLGKLGGNELNYSSDVDLMYIFGDGIEPARAAISNREYFIRLAQQVTEVLSRVTREGAVFRIDLRLRPQGNEGELAISLSQALRYYASSAHDWERQALIKIRYSAGSEALAREFTRGVQPQVYTEKVNFAAIKTALVAREKMHRKRHQQMASEDSAIGLDVKIDAGGIRDIEFLVQCLQRVYGGAEPWLRSGGTLFSLQKLHDKRHISSREFCELTTAYEFLRHLEHRLQLRQGQQIHCLPLDQGELRILQHSMQGYMQAEVQGGNFTDQVRHRMGAVAEIYRQIIYQQQSHSLQQAPDQDFQLRAADAIAADTSNRQILARLAADAPLLCEIAQRNDLSAAAHKNLFLFLTAAFTSSQRYAVLLRHAESVARALPLLEGSEYLTQRLIRHPEEIGTLADLEESPSRVASGYLFESFLGQSRAAADPVVGYLSGSSASYSEKLAFLRRHFRHRTFASGANDILQLRDVYRSLEATTAAADDAIAAALGIVGAPEGLAVMALGRLGSGEFDVLSDADVVFVCEQDLDREGLTKVAAQLMQALTAYTQEGMVLSVDARLRPRGGEGELLVSPQQLARYFEQEAHAWEALSYTKLRFVAGSRELGEQAMSVTPYLFERFAADLSFATTVCDMRGKLETRDRSLKTSAGGTYDVDFLCNFLLVRHRVANKRGTLRDRLWRCADAGLLEKTDAGALDHAAELLRTTDHVIRLAVGRVRKWLPIAEHARQVTEKLTSQILHRDFPRGLEAELEQTLREVRSIYNRVMASQ